MNIVENLYIVLLVMLEAIVAYCLVDGLLVDDFPSFVRL